MQQNKSKNRPIFLKMKHLKMMMILKQQLKINKKFKQCNLKVIIIIIKKRNLVHLIYISKLKKKE